MWHRGEFALIETLFAPLAAGFPGALGLRDDAALLDPPADCSVVVTTDAITGGVHFRPEDPPDLIARKLIRVNLSDLAAMGARPWAMVMAAAFPDSADDAWISRFTDGLRADGQHFSLPLIGGDTITTLGPATFFLTAFGLVTQGQALRRDGARVGDHLYVTGTIGDGALGLQVLTGHLSFTYAGPAFASHLVNRYHLPQPRLVTGAGLVGIATACVDISDGLLQDLSHLCRNSGTGAQVAVERLPLSPAAAVALGQTSRWLEAIITGGDDYELLFTTPPGMEETLAELASVTATPITAIGVIVSGREVTVHDSTGNVIPLARQGYQHF